MDEPVTDFERPRPYDCKALGHIFDRWHPASRVMIRRRCVIPGCGHVQSKEATG